MTPGIACVVAAGYLGLILVHLKLTGYLFDRIERLTIALDERQARISQLKRHLGANPKAARGPRLDPRKPR